VVKITGKTFAKMATLGLTREAVVVAT